MGTFRFILALAASSVGFILILPVLLAMIPLAVLSRFAVVIARCLEPGIARWGELIEFEPEIGWKPAANLSTFHLAEDVYQVSTDRQGWRGKTDLEQSDVVVFGDSFAWGFGIDDKRYFGNLLPDVRIKAIGTNGYNMVQELLWMRRLALKLKDKLVVWFIYFGNDLYENLTPDMCGYRMPFVRPLDGTREWQIVTDHVNATRWPSTPDVDTAMRNYYGKLADLCSRSFLSARAYPACAFLLRQGAELCREVGAELVVLTIPDVTQLTPAGRQLLLRQGGDPKSFDAELPDREIGRICSELGVRHVALKDHLKPEDYKVGDCHWNAKGHRKVAELLRELHRRHGDAAGNIGSKTLVAPGDRVTVQPNAL
ncbi:MAG TPA: hypothetical protein VNN77_09370 [candidate division Zixibacteria bacterium]|nr:hypothetical protein [candidate division Zixibacteria bacterium]